MVTSNESVVYRMNKIVHCIVLHSFTPVYINEREALISSVAIYKSKPCSYTCVYKTCTKFDFIVLYLHSPSRNILMISDPGCQGTARAIRRPSLLPIKNIKIVFLTFSISALPPERAFQVWLHFILLWTTLQKIGPQNFDRLYINRFSFTHS